MGCVKKGNAHAGQKEKKYARKKILYRRLYSGQKNDKKCAHRNKWAIKKTPKSSESYIEFYIGILYRNSI